MYLSNINPQGMKKPQRSKKSTITVALIIVILTVAVVFLAIQNAVLTRSTGELLKSYVVLLESNKALSAKATSLTLELQTFQENYNRLRLWGGEKNPEIQTRLGTTVIERYDIKDNYLWETGEVENVENVTIYDFKLNFALYAYNGVNESQILIGTMHPHQVITIRTTVMTQMKIIINWTIEPTASFVEFK